MQTRPTSTSPICYHRIYNKYFPILFRFALKFTSNKTLSKELAQNTLNQFWDNWKHNNEEKKAIQIYLFKTIKNEINNHHRKEKVLQCCALNFQNRIHFEEAITLFEFVNRIQRVYKKLPDKTKIIFQLYRIEGLGYEAIASQLKMPKKTVENHISNTIKTFRAEFYGNY